MKNSNNSIYVGKVLVLGSDNRAFLTVIRSLGRKNICVHVGWCAENAQALHSKYVSKYHNIPRFSQTNDWKEIFKDILRTENFNLVIPCNDSSIIPLQLYRAEFENICKIYLLDDECYELANDKFRMQKLTNELGINTPMEIELSKSTKVEDILSEFSFPVVLKPRSSFNQLNLQEKNFVVKVFSVEELRVHLTNLKSDEILCAQENFIGKGVGVELLVCKGEILYSFQHIRIHEPLTGGGSSYRKSVCVHPELLEASRKIMKRLNYTGVAMVEFKMNLETNKWVFIELNARFWGSLPLAVAAGADFPYFLYSMLINGGKNFSDNYLVGIYCRNSFKDFKWFIANLQADHSNQFLETVPLKKVVCEIFNVLSFNERNDTLTMDDIGPGIAELKDFFSKVSLKINKEIQSSTIVRILQNKKALSRLKRARRILFVCKGNICRSPFAHYYLESILGSGMIVESCGYFPKDGRSCPQAAIAAGKKLGIDLSSHRSSLINVDFIQNADMIFTFDEENMRTVIRRFPLAKSKIMRISSLDTASKFEITDPYSKDVSYFYDTYEQIVKLLDSLTCICWPKSSI